MCWNIILHLCDVLVVIMYSHIQFWHLLQVIFKFFFYNEDHLNSE